MGAKGDLILVILIITGLGIVWLFTGGPERERLDTGIFLKPPPPLGSGEKYGKFGVSIEKVRNNLDEVSEELEDIQARGEFSKYEDKITIGKKASGPKKDSAQEEYVILSASRRNAENISITGWKLESMISKKKMVIGGAVEVFRSGVINAEPPISLKAGEEVIISTGRSPIGASFKMNKCVGYFEQFQDFSPSLRKNCPSPLDEFDKFANMPPSDFTCKDIVKSLSWCEMPIDALPLGTTNSCSEFISKNINYTGCVKNHRNDLDFIGDEWRVFLGRSGEIWREKREIIRLLDNEGKIVDIYTY
ncbi:MAG: hypothetical protein QGG63_01410 [Candidatus Pacebacteria bacterium]|nr:hypothetical protein [Candidatus Paceibacterota bacterium]